MGPVGPVATAGRVSLARSAPADAPCHWLQRCTRSRSPHSTLSRSLQHTHKHTLTLQHTHCSTQLVFTLLTGAHTMRYTPCAGKAHAHCSTQRTLTARSAAHGVGLLTLALTACGAPDSSALRCAPDSSALRCLGFRV